MTPDRCDWSILPKQNTTGEFIKLKRVSTPIGGYPTIQSFKQQSRAVVYPIHPFPQPVDGKIKQFILFQITYFPNS